VVGFISSINLKDCGVKRTCSKLKKMNGRKTSYLLSTSTSKKMSQTPEPTVKDKETLVLWGALLESCKGWQGRPAGEQAIPPPSEKIKRGGEDKRVLGEEQTGLGEDDVILGGGTSRDTVNSQNPRRKR